MLVEVGDAVCDFFALAAFEDGDVAGAFEVVGEGSGEGAVLDEGLHFF